MRIFTWKTKRFEIKGNTSITEKKSDEVFKYFEMGESIFILNQIAKKTPRTY